MYGTPLPTLRVIDVSEIHMINAAHKALEPRRRKLHRVRSSMLRSVANIAATVTATQQQRAALLIGEKTTEPATGSVRLRK